MGETFPGSLFESKEKFHLQLQHIFQTTMKLTVPDQFDQFANGWSTDSLTPLMTFLTLSIKILTNLTSKAQLLNTNGREDEPHLSKCCPKTEKFCRVDDT